MKDMLPSPFEWVDIPAGLVELEDVYGVFEVPAFQISKYPITNAQFAKFIEAGGYQERKWWTASGWQQRVIDGWTEPYCWRDATWNGAEQPVVGVSWYEAVAFCRWLGETSGEPVTLPMEQQWQRAAQGDDRRVYPWGNEWDGARCNNSVEPFTSHQTTPVSRYPNGASPYGVLDMVGNVWEWCLTHEQSGTTVLEGTGARIVRGGSWGGDEVEGYRVAERGCSFPQFRNCHSGFRVGLADKHLQQVDWEHADVHAQDDDVALAQAHSELRQQGFSLSPLSIDSSSVQIPAKPTSVSPRFSVPELLPSPFEWVNIPAGRVELRGEHGVLEVAAFQIAKYPLTNAQYAKFVEAGGYQERKWWTEGGWEAREQGWMWNTDDRRFEPTGKVWTEPRHWSYRTPSGADHPVIGVSWYEAVAFCQWLSETSGEPVMLPTEQQWQRAAQGDDGRAYPWGNDWDGERCNNSVWPHNRKQTTSVTQYPNGASPYGVMDMSGNVMEWCLNDYMRPQVIDVDEQSEWRVLRGGSWAGNGTVSFRVTYRTGAGPQCWGYYWGFRCARAR